MEGGREGEREREREDTETEIENSKTFQWGEVHVQGIHIEYFKNLYY